jgi:hypothetical protein
MPLVPAGGMCRRGRRCPRRTRWLRAGSPHSRRDLVMQGEGQCKIMSGDGNLTYARAHMLALLPPPSARAAAMQSASVAMAARSFAMARKERGGGDDGK